MSEIPIVSDTDTSHVTNVSCGSESSRRPFLSNVKPATWQASQPAGEQTSVVPNGEPNGSQPVEEQTSAMPNDKRRGSRTVHLAGPVLTIAKQIAREQTTVGTEQTVANNCWCNEFLGTMVSNGIQNPTIGSLDPNQFRSVRA
jgi:hypothetical protein